MGYYQIGPRIGTGGMAEVYLGTHQAMGGFRKLVVMKRLLGWQSGDEEAIESLLDEARIAGTINHPNVVTTIDIGLDRGSPYIVLEYLSGEDLLFVLNELHMRDATIPLGVACRIGASIAAALSQAHDVALPDGSHRCIVHRDVTPSNIIVCYGGVTKLVDFGVARVVDDVPKTKAGTVKGKFSYLAPEQLTGAPLDGRTDVFQLGIVLWEMVTMRRLFDGKSDHERVNAVLNRAIRRPSKLNPALPPCLDRTIMRALDRNPARRHQYAHELEAELLEVLGAVGGSGGDHSVGKWMQTAFAERYRWRQALEQHTIAEAAAEANGDDDEIELSVESEDPESPWSRRRLETAPTRGSRGGPRTSGSSRQRIAVDSLVSPASSPRRGRGVWAILAIAAVAGAAWWWRGEVMAADPRDAEVATAAKAAAPAQAADYELDIRAVPAHATIAVDGVAVANGRYTASFASDGVVHTVTISAPDHATVQRRVHGPAMLEVNLEPLAGAHAEVAATAAANAAPPVQVEERGRTTQEARHRTRDRVRTNTPSPASPSTAATAKETTSSPSATPPPAPAPAKAADDSFAPSSDNLDPFKN